MKLVWLQFLLQFLVFASAFYQYKGHVTQFPCVPLQSSQQNGQNVKYKNNDSYIYVYTINI
jgi:hypothetical protein